MTLARVLSAAGIACLLASLLTENYALADAGKRCGSYHVGCSPTGCSKVAKAQCQAQGGAMKDYNAINQNPNTVGSCVNAPNYTCTLSSINSCAVDYYWDPTDSGKCTSGNKVCDTNLEVMNGC